MELRSLRSSFMATLTRLEQQVARGAVGNRSKVLQYPMVVFQYAEAQPAMVSCDTIAFQTFCT